jgi:hypothetical protein
MANDYYQIYRDSVKRMARTMVIRHDLSAQATNRYLINAGIPVGDDRRGWRYYMNIAGLYHSTNEMMQVQSLDTREMIDFTRENMAIHRATARGYAYGTRYYKELVAQWGRQERLIKGIINPVDIDVAINARENEILWIDPLLMSENEDNLKLLIQSQIDATMDRWHVEMYSLTESLYDCSRYVNLYAHMPAFIEFARWKNSRTERAHSFYIRQFLAANGRLDQWFDAMSLEQRLFFYRNLPYLHRYPGWQDTFDWLKVEVLEKRLFPLADYRLIQNVENMPNDLTPAVELIRQETTADYAGIKPTKASVRDVLVKQQRLALRNAETLEENEIETTQLMSNAQVSEMQTKVLESDVLDMTDSQIFKLEEFLINHWAYLALEERYLAIVTVEHPRTGEPIQLSALDAFILFLYVYNKSVLQDLTLVPDIHVSCVLKDPKPSAKEMFDVCCLGKNASINHANALWDMIPEFTSYISTESFYNAVNALYNAAVDQHNLAAFQGHLQTRAEVEAMGLYMFMDYGVSLAGEVPYDDWMNVRGLSTIRDLNQTECEGLSSALLQSATGMDLNVSLSLNDIHKAMIGIMQRLSSYSVHYVRLMNDSPLRPIDLKWIRIGDTLGTGEGHHEFDILKLKEIHSKGQLKGNSVLPNLDNMQVQEWETDLAGTSMMMFGLTFEQQTEKHGHSYIEMPRLRMFEPVLRPVTDLSVYKLSTDIIVGPLDPEAEHVGEVISTRYLSGLNYPNHASELTPLDRVITNVNLRGLEYPE